MPENQAVKHALTPEMRKKQWKPGQSGNPKGRPKKPYCFADILSAILKEVSEGNVTKLEALLREVYNHALKGESWAVNFIADRLEGKPKAALEIQVDEPKPITIIKDEW